MDENKMIAAVLAAGTLAQHPNSAADPHNTADKRAAAAVAMYRLCLKHLETSPQE